MSKINLILIIGIIINLQGLTALDRSQTKENKAKYKALKLKIVKLNKKIDIAIVNKERLRRKRDMIAEQLSKFRKVRFF